MDGGKKIAPGVTKVTERKPGARHDLFIEQRGAQGRQDKIKRRDRTHV